MVSWDSSVSLFVGVFHPFLGPSSGPCAVVVPESSTLVSLGGGHNLRMLVWMVGDSSSFVNVEYSFLGKGCRLMVLGV